MEVGSCVLAQITLDDWMRVVWLNVEHYIMVAITNVKAVALASLALTAAETLGQSMLRIFHDSKYDMNLWYLPLGAWVLYGVCCGILLWSYKYSDISAIETIWDAGTSVIIPLVGFLFFKNKINLESATGILLTILGIVLIGKGGMN